ncbi:Calcium-activated chloride channel regulator 1, partial [Stegodyphus mimosarum]
MMKAIFALTLTLYFISIRSLATSSIQIDNNGYSNILIALPRNLEKTEDRTRMINNLKNLLQQSSAKLMNATKGRAYFRNVTFIIPSKWNDPEYSMSDSQNSTSTFHSETEINSEVADIVVTDSPEDTSSYVLHHRGCGYHALRIYLSTGFLLSNHVLQNSSEFVRLWAEYRYGLFPEGGFQEDEKYPPTYQLPWKSTSSVTGCSSGKHCIYIPGSDDESCEEQFTSSLMDQNLPKASWFCEVEHYLGVRHFPEAPSKHNLLCREEGTWFTVL